MTEAAGRASVFFFLSCLENFDVMNIILKTKNCKISKCLQKALMKDVYVIHQQGESVSKVLDPTQGRDTGQRLPICLQKTPVENDFFMINN